MTIAHVGAVGGANSKAGNQSSIVMNVDNTVEVGNVIILCVAKDNAQTSFADNSEFTSVSDSKGNSWTKAVERTNAANAKASTVGAIFFTIVTTELVGATDAITVNFAASASNDASAVIADEFTITNDIIVVVDSGVNQADNTDLPSIALSGLDNIEHLFIYGGMKENTGIAYTASTGATLFTSSPQESTGGGAASNQSVMGEFEIATATSQTGDPADDTNADCIGLYIAFDEAAAPVGGAVDGSLLMMGVGI